MVPKGLLRLLLPGRKGFRGEKHGSCSNKDFLLPGAQPVCVRAGWSQEMYWIKQAFCPFSKSHYLVSSLCAHQEHSSHTSTREGPLKATKMDLGKNLGLMQAKPKSGFCLTKFWKTAQRGGSVEGDRRSLLKLHVPVFKWLFWLWVMKCFLPSYSEVVSLEQGR